MRNLNLFTLLGALAWIALAYTVGTCSAPEPVDTSALTETVQRERARAEAAERRAALTADSLRDARLDADVAHTYAEAAESRYRTAAEGFRALDAQRTARLAQDAASGGQPTPLIPADTARFVSIRPPAETGTVATCPRVLDACRTALDSADATLAAAHEATARDAEIIQMQGRQVRLLTTATDGYRTALDTLGVAYATRGTDLRRARRQRDLARGAFVVAVLVSLITR